MRDHPVKFKRDAKEDILLTEKGTDPKTFLQGNDPGPFTRVKKE